MEIQHKTSPIEAFRVATASIIFAITAQIILGLGFFVGLFAYRHGSLHANDLWLVLMVSCFPYAVLTLQTIWRVIGGMDSVFPQPQQSPSAIKNFIAHGIEGPMIDHHLVPVFNTPEPRINNVPIFDFIEFIDGIQERGVKARDWIGDPENGKAQYKFRTGRKCRYKTWKAIMDTLATVKVVVDMEPGRSAELTITSPHLIKDLLRLRMIIPDGY